MRACMLLAGFCLLAGACGRSEPHPEGGEAKASDTASSDSGAQTAALTVDARGMGSVRIGMTLRELGAAMGETLQPRHDINETCGYVRPKALPKGLSVMIVEDSVARVEIVEPGILTSEGAGVGDSEARVLALYGGRAQVQPHKYTGPTGHYVIVETPGDTLYRIVFETDGQKVTRYHAGRRPAVDFVEGCA
jgi:hypothetical protein